MGLASDILEFLASYQWSHLRTLFSTFVASPDPSGNIPPINRLPYELLLTIFSCEADDPPPNYDLEHFQRRLPRRTLVRGKRIDPILLGHVCKYWRDITLNTPLLWSSFFVLCNLKPQMVELLRLWLERSTDMPLDIAFIESLCDIKTDDEWHNPPQNPITPQIMELLTAHAHRWKAIDFEFSLQISPVLFNLPPGSFKILETANLRSRRATNVRFDGLEPLVQVWDLFHASPSFHTALYELEYSNHKLRDIPWSRLTCVDVTITMQDLFEVLPECQNLVELRYTDPLARYAARALPSRPGPPEPLTPVVLPSLRHLSMVATLSPDEAFHKLTLPRLESVYLRQNNIWLVKPDPHAFTNLLTRSECTLRQFSYHGLGSPIAEEILGEMLISPSMSSVIDLTVDARVTDKFAEVMTGPASKAVLPRLESFTLVRPSMEAGTLGKMISSLREERESFQFFNAQYWDRHEQDRKKFSELREKGIVIKD